VAVTKARRRQLLIVFADGEKHKEEKGVDGWPRKKWRAQHPVIGLRNVHVQRVTYIYTHILCIGICTYITFLF